MNLSKIPRLLQLILAKLRDPDIVAGLKWPTPTLSIALPVTETQIVVELGTSNRREGFTVLFKDTSGYSLMCLGFFGSRAITGSHGAAALVAEYGNHEFHDFLQEVDEITELIWERCVEIYFDQMVGGYKSRASAGQKDVSAFFEYLLQL